MFNLAQKKTVDGLVRETIEYLQDNNPEIEDLPKRILEDDYDKELTSFLEKKAVLPDGSVAAVAGNELRLYDQSTGEQSGKILTNKINSYAYYDVIGPLYVGEDYIIFPRRQLIDLGGKVTYTPEPSVLHSQPGAFANGRLKKDLLTYPGQLEDLPENTVFAPDKVSYQILAYKPI
jgi:hypothetical protein